MPPDTYTHKNIKALRAPNVTTYYSLRFSEHGHIFHFHFHLSHSMAHSSLFIDTIWSLFSRKWDISFSRGSFSLNWLSIWDRCEIASICFILSSMVFSSTFIYNKYLLRWWFRLIYCIKFLATNTGCHFRKHGRRYFALRLSSSLTTGTKYEFLSSVLNAITTGKWRFRLAISNPLYITIYYFFLLSLSYYYLFLSSFISCNALFISILLIILE